MNRPSLDSLKQARDGRGTAAALSKVGFVTVDPETGHALQTSRGVTVEYAPKGCTCRECAGGAK